jgi:hypothetical protein
MRLAVMLVKQPAQSPVNGNPMQRGDTPCVPWRRHAAARPISGMRRRGEAERAELFTLMESSFWSAGNDTTNNSAPIDATRRNGSATLVAPRFSFRGDHDD